MSFFDEVKFREYEGEPSLNDLYPEPGEKAGVFVSWAISLALSLGGYRSARKRDWGAATWKTLASYVWAKEIQRQLERRAEKFATQKRNAATERTLEKTLGDKSTRKYDPHRFTSYNEGERHGYPWE